MTAAHHCACLFLHPCNAAAHHHARITCGPLSCSDTQSSSSPPRTHRTLSFFVQCRPRLTTLSSSMSVTTQQQRSGLHGRVGRPSPSPWLWTLTRLCASHQVRNTLKRYEEKKKKKILCSLAFVFVFARSPSWVHMALLSAVSAPSLFSSCRSLADFTELFF